MSIITSGLGGNSLITQGYGFLEWIKEKIQEIVRYIRRIIPVERKKFSMKIEVRGDVVHPFLKEIEIRGKRDQRELLRLILGDED